VLNIFHARLRGSLLRPRESNHLYIVYHQIPEQRLPGQLPPL